MNAFDLLRLQHILPPSSDSTFGNSGGNPSSTDMNDGNGNVNEDGMSFTPDHEASDRFTKLLDAYPKEKKPGLLRSIATALSGGAAAFGKNNGNLGQEMDLALHPGHDRDVQEWKNQIAPAEQSANLERYSNTNLRQMAFQSRQADTAARRVDATTNRYQDMNDQADRRQTETERSNRAKEQDAQDRTALMKYKQDNPAAKYDFSGTTVKVMDKDGIHDTGMPTDKVSQMDRLIYQRGTSEAVANINAGSREKVASERIDSTTNKPETANNQAQRWLNNAKELIRTDPKGLGKHIQLDPNDPKGFKIAPQSTDWGGFGSNPTGPTDDELKKINDYINNTMPPKAGGGMTTTIKNVNMGSVGKSGSKETPNAEGSVVKPETGKLTPPVSPKAGWHYEEKLDASGKHIGWTAVKDK